MLAYFSGTQPLFLGPQVLPEHLCHQFLSILYRHNSEYWTQTCTQNGNIHSMKLDVYAEKQSASNIPFVSSQHIFPWVTIVIVYNWYNEMHVLI